MLCKLYNIECKLPHHLTCKPTCFSMLGFVIHTREFTVASINIQYLESLRHHIDVDSKINVFRCSGYPLYRNCQKTVRLRTPPEIIPGNNHLSRWIMRGIYIETLSFLKIRLLTILKSPTCQPVLSVECRLVAISSGTTDLHTENFTIFTGNYF